MSKLSSDMSSSPWLDHYAPPSFTFPGNARIAAGDQNRNADHDALYPSKRGNVDHHIPELRKRDGDSAFIRAEAGGGEPEEQCKSFGHGENEGFQEGGHGAFYEEADEVVKGRLLRRDYQRLILDGSVLACMEIGSTPEESTSALQAHQSLQCLPSTE